MRVTTILAFALLVACSGKIAGAPSSSGDSSPTTPPSANPAPPSGGSSGLSPSCAAVSNLLASRACVPGAAKANVATTIAVEALACICNVTPTSCSATVSGPIVTLEVDGQSCLGDYNCSDGCSSVMLTCTLPPLAAGSYTLAYGELGHDLEVAADGATSCELGFADPPPLDPSRYDTSCNVDADCEAVSMQPCGACQCATTIISKTSDAAYRADYRAAQSQCTNQATNGICACPMIPVPHCDAQKRCGP